MGIYSSPEKTMLTLPEVSDFFEQSIEKMKAYLFVQKTGDNCLTIS